MSTMYFAKLNFNSEIYEVYKDRSVLDNLLNQVYQQMSEKIVLKDNGQSYKFITLTKNPDEFWVSGRIVLYAPGVNISYDPEKDNIVEESVENSATYSTFFFDVGKEEIAFVPKLRLGHNMFIRMFKELLEHCVPEVEFEIFLENNINLLEEKIKNIYHAQMISIDVVPPNGDREDFQALFSTDAEEIKDTNATKFTIRLKSAAKKSMNLSSKYIRKLIAAVSKGFGEMEVTGKDAAGTRIFVKSSEDALYTKPIPDSDKDNLIEFPSYGKAGISELMENKIRVEIE